MGDPVTTAVGTPPHILTLVNDDEHDDDMPLAWTSATLACPYDPPRADVPCAVLDRCGCPVIPAEEFQGGGPCPASPDGRHAYGEWDDHPQCPKAECWAAHHAEGLDDVARGLPLGPGRHEVWPVCEDGGLLGLLLRDPDVSAAAMAAARATQDAGEVQAR